MIVATKFLDNQLRKWLKVEDEGILIFEMHFENLNDLNKVANELEWTFSVMMKKQYKIVDNIK